MKKLTALISALSLLLFLCACSDPGAESTGNTGASPDPAASQAVSDGPVLNTAGPVETPTPGGESEGPEPSEELSTEELKAIAIELSERRAPVSELYAAIGQPISSDYAPGCLAEGENGEDGELYYDGFIVYTGRSSTQEEFVYDVLGDDEL